MHNGLFEDPNDQGFWAVVRRRPGGGDPAAAGLPCPAKASCQVDAEGALDAGQGTSSPWIRPAPDPPADGGGLHAKRLARIDDRIVANAPHRRSTSPTKGEVDFVSEVAALVPMHNISATWWASRGAPPDHRRVPNSPTVGAIPSPAGRRAAGPGGAGHHDGHAIAARTGRGPATQKPEDDLVTALVQAEVDGGSSPMRRSPPSSSSDHRGQRTPPGSPPRTA